MAKYVGKGGSVTVAGSAIGNLSGWGLTEAASPIEQKDMGDEYQVYSSTDADHPKTWEGTAEAYFDEADAAQAALTPGAQVALVFLVRGSTSGFPDRTGNAIVTSVEESAETDGNLMVSFSFVGNGALTRGTVA